MRTWAAPVGRATDDGGVGVLGEHLLGPPAGVAELGQRRRHQRVVGVEPLEEVGGVGPHVLEHGGVDVDPAQLVDPFGRAEADGPPVVADPQDRGVERAAAEVVDGDHGSGGRAGDRGVVGGRGVGLGAEVRGAREVRQRGDLAELLDLVGAPVGRIGEGERGGGPALLGGDAAHDVAEHLGEQRLGRPRGATDEDGRRIAEASLELPGHPGGVARRAGLGGLAHQHGAVGVDEDHRGDRRAPAAEGDHLRLGLAVAPDRRGRERRPQIDPSPVRHVGDCRHVCRSAGQPVA